MLDFLEFFLGFFIPLVHIRVMFSREVSVRFLYLVLRRVSRYAEHRVKIFFRVHEGKNSGFLMLIIILLEIERN